MKEEQQRKYLKKEDKLNIISKFFESIKVDNQFGYKDLGEFLEKNYEWYRKLSKHAQESRIWDLATVMKETYSENIVQEERIGFGAQAKWTLISKPKEITPISEEKTEKERKPRRCNRDRLGKFYLVVKEALYSKVGISKKDVEQIMGYETNMTVQGVNSLNDQIESETGFRPLTIDKNHIFVNYDILQVNNEMAEMVLQELSEKLEGIEPTMPALENDFESIVKSVIRKDYAILSMFTKSSTIFYNTGEMEKFRDSIVAKTVTLGIDKVVEIYNENLKRRYDINLNFICKPRKYVTIADNEDNSNVRQALMKIEQVFAEYFCEDIVNKERTIWEQEHQKEITPDEQEQSQLDMIEYAVFKGQDGELFLSELWKKLDLLNVGRGWKILDILKKSPEKFKVKSKPNSEGTTEYLITYTAPIKKESEKVEKEEDETEIHNETTNHSENQICRAVAAFKERLDLEYFCRNGIEFDKSEIEVHNDEFIVEIKYDKAVKESVRAFLKLYYASLRSSSIKVFFVKESYANELENLY